MQWMIDVWQEAFGPAIGLAALFALFVGLLTALMQDDNDDA